MLAAAALLGAARCAVSSLRFLPAGHLDAAQSRLFNESVAQIRGSAVCLVAHSRHGGAHRSADRPMGSVLVAPPEERRVQVVEGFRSHLDAASLLPFPPDSRLRAAALSDDLRCAAAFAVRMGPQLDEWRRRGLDDLRAISERLRPVSVRINELMSSTVRLIASGVNTAFMAAVIDAIGWLDVDLVKRFVEGFSIIGDIPDSGVYRPIEAIDSLVHLDRLGDFYRSAGLWNAVAARRLERRRFATPDERAKDAAVAAKTAEERAKGLVVGPYSSVDALWDALAARVPGVVQFWGRTAVQPRIILRFGVRQKDSLRAIDDAKSNGANRATRLAETVTTPSFFFPAVVARAVGEAAAARCDPPVAMSIALLDLSSAYRTIPTSQPHLTAFGFYDPEAGAPRYYWMPGHNFGLASAVVNFNRYPELVTVALRVILAVLLDHFYDDFLVPDLASGGASARLAVEQFILFMGIGRPRHEGEYISSPEIDPRKTKPTAGEHIVLGVLADVSHTADDAPFVRFAPDSGRVARVLGAFRVAFERGRLPPHEAASLRGKLFFVLSAAYGSVGRAATLPLVQRQYRDKDYSFVAGSELHHSLLFFEALLPALPPLVVALRPDPRPPLLVYTDASFSFKRRRKTSGSARECAADGSGLSGALGAVVYDPVDGTVRFAAADPPWAILFGSWIRSRKTYIAELETLAALSVYTTYPDLFAGRRVNHFVDNTVALSALVHGYSGKVDLAKAVNVFYLQLTALRASVYLDWVPSKANIADLPSRGAWDQLRGELAGLPVVGGAPDLLAVPSVAAWRAPLSAWASRRDARDKPMPI